MIREASAAQDERATSSKLHATFHTGRALGRESPTLKGRMRSLSGIGAGRPSSSEPGWYGAWCGARGGAQARQHHEREPEAPRDALGLSPGKSETTTRRERSPRVSVCLGLHNAKAALSFRCRKRP